MPSKSSRLKSDSSKSPELVRKLLQHGALFREPSEPLAATAQELRASGIITANLREFVRCANPGDGDYPPRNRHCNGRVYLDQRLLESGGELHCPECERPIFPDTYHKRRHAELHTRVDPEGVMTFLKGNLKEGGIVAKPLGEGVLRLDVGPEGVTLCVVEFCQDHNYLSRERAIQNPTCFVAIGSRDFDERFKEEWIARVTLAELICGQVNLTELIQGVAASGRPQSVAIASIPVCEMGPSSVIVEAAPRQPPSRLFVVEVGNSIVRIEGVKVVAEQAGPRFILFRTMWQWFLDDLRNGIAPEAFRAWPLKKLMEELESQTGKEHSDETVVRRVINNMQNDFEEKLRQELGLAVGREDIVQTRRSQGQTDNSYGYRINPFTVAARPFRFNLSQQS